MKNPGRDSSLNGEKELPIKAMFLDPEGENFEQFEEDLSNAIKLLELWWKSKYAQGSPTPSKDEVRKLLSALDEQTRVRPFARAYKHVESCMRLLYENVRFNKNNLMNIHPSPLLPAVMASFMTMLQNPNNLSPATSPSTTLMEKECISELAKLVGFIDGTGHTEPGGNILSCGTISNLTALLVAREKTYQKMAIARKRSFKELGLFEAPRGVVVTSASAHYSIRKAVRILGLGERSIVEVPVANEDEVRSFEESCIAFKLRPSKEAYAETLTKINEKARKGKGKSRTVLSVVAALGTINTGTVEPIRALLGLRDEYEFHLHIDGAIGGFALGISEVREKASGVEAADSITLDPHKLGFIGYPCSVILFRDKSDLESISMNVPYLDSRTYSIEGSRPGFSAAGLWVGLKTLGVEGYSKIISRCVSLTRKLADILRDAGYQILHEVDLNALCFSVYKEGESRKKLNASTDELHRRVTSDGQYLVGKIEDLSGIKVRDEPWEKRSETVSLTGIKVWIMNPYTSEHDLEAFVEELNRKRKEIAFK
nr:aspartate aminotransferase family protein [Candidatus Njordarchaeum guaymaensis]